MQSNGALHIVRLPKARPGQTKGCPMWLKISQAGDTKSSRIGRSIPEAPLRFVYTAWFAVCLAASVAPTLKPAPAWAGQWEIVADPLTAHGLGGLPDSICGSGCTLRETPRGMAIERASIFDLGLPAELIPNPKSSAAGPAAWQLSRTADALTITGSDPSTGAGPGGPATRYVLSVRGEFLHVDMTRLTDGGSAPPTFTLLYRRAYSQPDR